MTLPKLTAPQDLMVDLLVARTRLGEPFWPISTKLTRTYTELSAKGYVEVLHGHVSGTVRLSLTATARKELIDDSNYRSNNETAIANRIADKLTEQGADVTTIKMIRKQFGQR